MNLKNKSVHFIGIGGISMSGIAEILLSKGISVSGSDRSITPIIKKLIANGVTFYTGHNSENINGSDIVVYTSAIAKDNPELVEAKNKNIKLYDRAEFLGKLMKDYENTIAISGVHGKTTTTSMMSHVLVNANTDPTILVGGNLDLINGNCRVGHSNYFLTESCEYKANFLKFYPSINVILNIDADHLDFYRDINHIDDTFREYAKNTGEILIGNANDSRVKDIVKNSGKTYFLFGINDGDIRADNLSYNKMGCGSYDCNLYTEDINETIFLFHIDLKVPGEHNVLNSLSVVCASLAFDTSISGDQIKNGIESFSGVHKRFEFKGEKNNIVVIDDYAHHPTEIKTTLHSSKKLEHNRIFCVFQPHTYSRTKTLFNDFSTCFSGADEVIVADIYAAREPFDKTITSKMLSDEILKNGIKSCNLNTFDEIVNYLNENCKAGDIILTVGAGDIVSVGESFLNNLSLEKC